MGFTLRCAVFFVTIVESMLAWPPRVLAVRCPGGGLWGPDFDHGGPPWRLDVVWCWQPEVAYLLCRQ